ncbi:MAG: hypothetical protein KDG50_00740 [Chromatiales bacterium]|nr:hypothetical protein [Chromatiales bacterium]
MSGDPAIVITGSGAVCGLGSTPADIATALFDGRSAIAPVTAWDTAGWPRNLGAEVHEPGLRELVPDRKVHKLIRRTDFYGIFAAERAVDAAGWLPQRSTLDAAACEAFNDRTGVYVGSGGGNFENQYDYFPLFDAAAGHLPAFGRELDSQVSPMWLLRALPNNVLCHVGIRLGFKGANACITNHAVSGLMAVIEAAEGLRGGEADRAVAVGHDSPLEPQVFSYMHRLGLLAAGRLRSFDRGRDGSVLGEGAAAVTLETRAAAQGRAAAVLGEYLGGGVATDGQGILELDPAGDGLVRAIRAALADAGLEPAGVGAIFAHGNGTPLSDASEAAALCTVFGEATPPLTACKWGYGHLIAASGIIDLVVALEAMRAGRLPGIATLETPDPALGPLRVSSTPQAVRGSVALVIARGFAGIDAAVLLRVAARTQ